MQLQLDDGQLKSLISEAILQSLDEQKKDALIKASLQHLLTEESVNYGSKRPSPLEQAFRHAANDVAREVAREQLLNNADFKSQVQKLMQEAMNIVFEKKAEAIADKLGDAIANGLGRDY